ncbi:hypothetical protein [Tissierella praeacuta]|uniref:hypothetical protein n=1 Tax=Tissierella praeacuta TaxID=43131 RepID=UPI0028AFBBCC|nr:hypothetical protein [Tissierella praeacuta]
MEKYIQYNVNLTDIELYQLIILKIEENKEYKGVIGKEKIIEIFLYKNINIGNKIYSIEIEYQEFNSIRRIERFLKDNYNSINRLKVKGLKSSEDLIIRTVLIFNMIKYFYPSVYEEFTINRSILEIFTLNIDGKEYSYEYFYNKNRMEYLQNYIESEDNQSIAKSRNLFNLFILDKLQYNIHGEYYKDIYKSENAIERLEMHYEESNMNLIRRHNNMAMDRIFWNLLSAGKSELTELEICGQKFIEDVLSYDKNSWKSRYEKYCNDLFCGGYTIFIMGIEKSLQLFKAFRIINPEEKYWNRLLEFSKKEFFDVINYEFISAINYVPMENIEIHKKVSELILDLKNEGNLNSEKEFLNFLKIFYTTWYGLGGFFPHPIEYINYINIEDSNYIRRIKSLLENHIEVLDNIESSILEDEIKVNIKVTKKLIELISLEKSLEKKEYKPKVSFESSIYNKNIIEELLELKQIDLDKFREKAQEYYYSGTISKSDIIKKLEI